VRKPKSFRVLSSLGVPPLDHRTRSIPSDFISLPSSAGFMSQFQTFMAPIKRSTYGLAFAFCLRETKSPVLFA
jgi:hypothetical protein